jgi:ParB family chromosome partitioning protein
MNVGIECITPFEGQPRQLFTDESIDELAESIKQHGVIQPIIVRRNGPATYQIVAGERRWRAAQRAGLHDIPAVLKDVAPQDMLTLALVENLQREDLNPIEEAEAYKQLMDSLHLTQEQVAERVTKNRSTVANALRLLKLPPQIRSALMSEELSMGHAKALLSLLDSDDTQAEEAMLRAAREVIAKNLSVRDTERLVRTRKNPTKSPADTGPTPAQRDLEDRLRQHLGVKCTIQERKGKGRLEIHFNSLDELDNILARIHLP